MKIYASQRKKFPWELVNDLMGKDLWVGCGRYINDSFAGMYYVKFIGTETQYGRVFYTVSAVNAELVVHPEFYRDRVDDDYISELFAPFTVLPDTFSPLTYHGFDIYTTEELIEAMKGEQ